jgi:hypothetical protein
MKYNRWWIGIAGYLILAMTGPVTAQPNAVDQIPAQAPIVVHLRGIERTKDRLFSFIGNALPREAAQMVKTSLDQALKAGGQGRQLEGRTRDGSVFFCLANVPQRMQDLKQIGVIFQVTSYAKFRDGILTAEERKTLQANASAGYEVAKVNDQDVYFIDGRNGYVIVAFDAGVATRLREDQAGLGTKLGKAAARFLEADLAVYLDIPQLNQAYAPMLKAARPFIEHGLRQGLQFDTRNQGVADPIRQMTDLFCQAIVDGRSVVACMTFQPEGVAFHVEGWILPGTKTSRFVRPLQPTVTTELAKLPGGLMGYSAFQVEPPLLEAFPAILYGVTAAKENQRTAELRVSLEQLAAAGPKIRTTGFQLAGHEIGAWTYREPVKAVEARLRLLKALTGGDTFEGAMLKERPTVMPNAEMYRGFQLHSVQIAWDIDRIVEAQAEKDMPETLKRQMRVALKKLMGDGKKTWFGTDGQLFIQVAGKNWEDARRQLDQFLDNEGPVGSQAAFQETRNHLPARTTVLTLVDMAAYGRVMGAFLGKVMRAVSEELPPEAAKIPIPRAVKSETTYVGIALTLEPDLGILDVWLPAPAAGVMYRIFVEPMARLLLESPN